MLRTFNCGVGMVLCLAEADAARAVELLENEGEKAWVLGRILPASGHAVVEMNGTI
jgi:phosphoribosylformylglycinamidine cyclo-ligase